MMAGGIVEESAEGRTTVGPEGMVEDQISAHIGRRVSLPGHFDVPVVLEDARRLGADASAGYECRVRLPDGALEEAVISSEEAAGVFATGDGKDEATAVPSVDPERLRLLVESVRIRLAYAYDRQFAVSLSGIRTLPHQIEAVYRKMLPQPRLRFLLADDPGAGKTIMAGLLIKELKLREAIDRCLILVPAPLTIQWQDELLRFFDEPFQIIHSANDQQQLLNLWERESQIVSSIDYAKQDGVRERVWQQRWDLIIIDEAHKCSAYTKRSMGRGDEVERTKRYQLAERLSEQCDNLLLLTATPHHGDDDRFRALYPPHRSRSVPRATSIRSGSRSGSPRHLASWRELPVVSQAAEGRPEGPAWPPAVPRPARSYRQLQPRSAGVRDLQGGDGVHQRISAPGNWSAEE